MKKEQLSLSIILLLLPLLFACKKESLEFTIRGNIFDDSFNKGLVGAEVELTAVEANSGDLRSINTQTLGESGDYSFTFLRDRDIKYYLTVNKDNYFPLNKTIFFSELTVENDNVFNYSTTAKSFINFKIKNTGVSDDQDQLKLEIFEAKTDCDECCSLGQHYFNGANIDTNYYCANAGNQYYKFIYWVPEMNIVVFDSLITPAFDTVEYYIEY